MNTPATQSLQDKIDAHGDLWSMLYDGPVHRFEFPVKPEFSNWVDELLAEVPNAMHTKAGPMQGAWGDPNQIFRHGAYDLGPDEALVIEFTPPECFYWNFQVDNRWMESLDYRFLPVTVNKHSAVYEADGSVKIVVAHRDPGFGNWMSTDGHPRGAIGLRWNQAVDDVEPTYTVVTLEGERA